MTARVQLNDELSPTESSGIIKQVPVEKIKLGSIKLQSAMDLEEDGIPQVEEMPFEEEKKIEIEKVSDKKKLMMEKTK